MPGNIIKYLLLNIIIFFTVRVTSQSLNVIKNVNLDFKGQPLSLVLERISSQTGIHFIYADNLLNNKNVSCNIRNKPPVSALNEVLNRFDISYRIFNNNSFVLFKNRTKNLKLYNEVIVRQNIPEPDTSHIVTSPVLLSRNKPIYPIEAIKNEIEGKLAVKLFVTKDGNVSKINIESSSGSAMLDSATAEYSRNLKFIPAQTDGKYQNMWMTMIFEYILERK